MIADRIQKLIDPLNQGGNQRTAAKIESELYELLREVCNEQKKACAFEVEGSNKDYVLDALYPTPIQTEGDDE